MKRFFCCLSVAFLLMTMCFFSCSDEPESVVSGVCDEDTAITQLKERFSDFQDACASSRVITLAKQVTVPSEGQVIGHEKHTFTYSDQDGICNFTEIEAEKEVGDSRLVNNFQEGWSKFFRNDHLVYTDTALETKGRWLRRYVDLENVPVKAPNWAASGGEDLYMTWIARSSAQASRVPIWGVESVWQKDGDDLTLMGGKILLKNPTKRPDEEELVLVLRMDGDGGNSSNVNPRGVLWPVGQQTWDDYLSWLKGDADEWGRDYIGDRLAMQDFFSGAIRNSRIRRSSLDRVYSLRDLQTAPLPNVEEGFLPAFEKLGPIS